MEPYRHPFPGGGLGAVLRDLPAGTGVSVTYYRPFWDVVARRSAVSGRTEYIVTDCSRPNCKPLRVFGPVPTQAEAEAWATATASLWHGLFVTDVNDAR